jgi:SecD/SecF fusion protein
LSACGGKKYRLNLKDTGGIYLEYQVDKEPFTYADEYEDGMRTMAFFIRTRLGSHCVSEVYVKGERVCVEISKEQDTEKFQNIIERNPELYLISEYDADGNLNFEEKLGKYELTKDIEELVKNESAILYSKYVSEARAGYQQDDKGNDEIVIQITLTDEGTKQFADMTREAYNNNRARIAFYYDGEILTAPSVQAVISDGHMVMPQFNGIEEAEEVASVLRIGPMPYGIKRIESKIFERKKLQK